MSQHAGPMPLTQLGEDEQMFRDTVRRFAVEQIGPLVRGMEESEQMDTGLIKKLFELGLMGIEIPEQYGGAGGSFFNAILAVEEISAVDPSVGVMVDVQNTLCINALVRWANEEQKKKYLTRLATDTIGSYALSEASSGSDAFALQTRAVQRGDDFILNGQKLWITNAKEAGVYIVFATLDPAAGYKGITAFLLEKDTPGFTLGKKENKLGIRASSTCALNFNDCAIHASQVLGEPGKGYKIAIENLNFLKEAAMCKYFASQVAERVASLAVEVFGGSGFVKDYPVEKLYRDAKIGKIYEGTSFMQLATIAKLTLGRV